MATVQALKISGGRLTSIPTTDSQQLASLGVGTTPPATGITVTGGPVSLTGNAASDFTTSSGALTITSAAAATWGTSGGNLALQSAGATRLEFSTSGEWLIGASAGTSGYVLTSNGAGAAPTWQSAGGGGSGWLDDGTTVRLSTAGDEVVVGSATPITDAKVSIYAESATNKPLVIRLAATPTANALEIQDSAGTQLFAIPAAANALHIPDVGTGSFAISDSGVSALGASATAVGYSSDATGAQSSAFGNGAQAGHTGARVFGYQSSSTAVNQFVAGSTGATTTSVYFGAGVTEAPAGAQATSFTLSGTAATGTDKQGGAVTIAAGNGTGTGGSGTIVFRVAKVAATSSTPNTITDTLTMSRIPAVFFIPNESGAMAISDSAVNALTSFSTAVGYLSDAAGGASATAFGYNARATAGTTTAIGASSSCATGSTVCVGSSATAPVGGTGFIVAVGASTTVSSHHGTALGYAATIPASLAAGSIALGSGATVTAAGQIVVGSDTTYGRMTDLYIGGGISSTSVTTFPLLTFRTTTGAGYLVPGQALTIQPGNGGNSADTGTAGRFGGDGGALTLKAGTGGGSATSLNHAGAGGAVTIAGGDAGVNNGGGGYNGGDATLRAGALSGSGVDGNVIIGATNTAEIRVGASGKKIGFFGVTAVVQQADIGALTDSTGGTADNTVAAVSGSGADATINNNFADLIDQINQLRTTLRNYGLMA